MRIDVGGRRLYFDVDGAGLVASGPELVRRPTLLLLHGGPGGFDHSYLKPDFSLLTDVAQVVWLDMREHGRSDRGDPTDWSFDDAADDLSAFCSALEIDRPIVLGHSYGGLVVMAFGARHPGLAAGLVLHSSFARFDLDATAERFRRLGGDEAADTVRRVYTGEHVPAEVWDRCWRLFGRWVPGDDERARVDVNAELNAGELARFAEIDASHLLAAIDDPTLVVVGEHDPIAPLEEAQRIATVIGANARVSTIGGAGHFAWRDEPDTHWSTLREFIADVS